MGNCIEGPRLSRRGRSDERLHPGSSQPALDSFRPNSQDREIEVWIGDLHPMSDLGRDLSGGHSKRDPQVSGSLPLRQGLEDPGLDPEQRSELGLAPRGAHEALPAGRSLPGTQDHDGWLRRALGYGSDPSAPAEQEQGRLESPPRSLRLLLTHSPVSLEERLVEDASERERGQGVCERLILVLGIEGGAGRWEPHLRAHRDPQLVRDASHPRGARAHRTRDRQHRRKGLPPAADRQHSGATIPTPPSSTSSESLPPVTSRARSTASVASQERVTLDSPRSIDPAIRSR